tara:strand:- start:80 stop:247 length:168 start_codon:yes stop_codon:yes gene_type:complete
MASFSNLLSGDALGESDRRFFCRVRWPFKPFRRRPAAAGGGRLLAMEAATQLSSS